MKGAYILILRLKKNSQIKIGSLGPINFQKGFYCYVGSALGKIGIKKRIERYEKLNQKRKGNKKWHIDYFLTNPNVSILGVLIFPSKKKIECKISKKLERGAEKVIPKFGSSDCKCKSHLYYFKSIGILNRI
jgi:Uri superfamily endonuclease